MNAGELVRRARGRAGLSQARLARRAGTSQARISRIERGLESPTLDRLELLLLVAGETLQLDSRSSTAPAAAGGSPAERLREAVAWNRAASSFSIAGEDARRAGHPATRMSDP